MITISLCMIVKNEADVLARCLESVRAVADEIIVVDTGSTDATIEIASRYTKNLYHFDWVDDFSAARNFSFSKATMDYCMWLDADDVLLPADQAALLSLKETLSPDTDMVMLPYHTAMEENGQPTFVYHRERLMRRAARFVWEGAVHEAISPRGKIVYGTAAVTHRKTGPGDPDRNLRIFQALLDRGTPLSPREQYYYARELTYHGRDEEAICVLEQFLDSGEGWVENELDACRILSQCFQRLGKEENAFRALVRALRYGPPRGELCCDLGQFFLQREDWRTAAYWYEQALHCPRPDSSGAFVSPDCYGYVPALQMCVCSYHLGHLSEAKDWNEQAEQYKPGTEACRYNRRFFDSLSEL